MAALVEVTDLIYEYPGKRALHGVSVSIESGWVVALVGPNGAGKSTLLRTLCALEDPFSGKVAVDGLDTQEEPRQIHRLVGYLADFYGLYDELTVRQSLTYLARIHEVPPSRVAESVEQVLEEVELQEHAHKPAGTLSRGLRQRLAIAQAIIHRPKLLILDEPAAGLDPEARLSLSRLIQSLQTGGITLIVSSHILAELEDYSTHMLTMNDGRIVALQPIQNTHTSASRTLRARFVTGRAIAPNALMHSSRVSKLERQDEGREFSFLFTGTEEDQAQLLAELIRASVDICALQLDGGSMQDVYIEQMKDSKKGGKE